MILNLKCTILLLLGLCAVLASTEGDGDSNEGRDNMEHLFPLLFLMGGAPTVHCPTVWLVGMLMIGAMYFMTKIKNL